MNVAASVLPQREMEFSLRGVSVLKRCSWFDEVRSCGTAAPPVFLGLGETRPLSPRPPLPSSLCSALCAIEERSARRRVCLRWRAVASFASRAAKISVSRPASLSAGVT